MLEQRETAKRIEKLGHEIAILADQRTRKHRALELLKSLAGPAAVAGLISTIFFNGWQMQQANRSRDDERFDRAVARLGSTIPAERLTGLVGLELFLTRDYPERHKAALTFLANILAEEQNATVRSAMLQTLSKANHQVVDRRVLDDVLVTVRERNRSLLQYRREKFEEKIKAQPGTFVREATDEIPIGKLTEVEIGPLRATGDALSLLIRNGAKASDLSRIYCVRCDLSGRDVDLSGVNFDYSLLKSADFSHANLRAASFDASNLVGTKFVSSDLRGAKLTDHSLVRWPVQSALIGGHLAYAQQPDFSCADLSGADFTGAALFGIYWNKPNTFISSNPIVSKANLAGADLSKIELFVAIPRNKVRGDSFESYRGLVPVDHM